MTAGTDVASRWRADVRASLLGPGRGSCEVAVEVATVEWDFETIVANVGGMTGCR
jgi:hypothetical protein